MRHTVTDDGGGVVTVRLVGDADLKAVQAMSAALAEARGTAGVREIVVDLADVPFVDSSGLGSLVGGYRLATQDGLGFAVTNPRPAVRSLLALTGVLQLFTEK